MFIFMETKKNSPAGDANASFLRSFLQLHHKDTGFTLCSICKVVTPLEYVKWDAPNRAYVCCSCHSKE
jgi:hypothetical protein